MLSINKETTLDKGCGHVELLCECKLHDDANEITLNPYYSLEIPSSI